MSRLAGLPPRPPTPPKETAVTMGLVTGLEQIDLPVLPRNASKALLGTPDQSPKVAVELPCKSSGQQSKRVGFLIGPGGATPITTSSPDSNAFSAQSRQPKSILKQPLNPLPSETAKTSSQQGPPDIPRMIEDTCRQLTSPSTSCRLDAYVSLNGCLKTYKTQATIEALKEKASLVNDFVQRDLANQERDDIRGTQITLEVLRLITTLAWAPAGRDILSSSLQSYILDRVSNIIEQEKSKQLVIQSMFLLSTQCFRPALMINDRANRLVTTLKLLTDRVNGKQIITHRLGVYTKLLTQARGVMLVRLNDWIEHVFYGMMSEVREPIRVRAIKLGLNTAQAFQTEGNLAKTVKNCFNAHVQIDTGTTKYGDIFIGRLTQWLGSKDDARFIPSIWSTIVLMLAHPQRNLEKWSFFVPWLKLIQKCFNSSDEQVRIFANRAWVRLIYAVNPDGDTASGMIQLLRDPILPQLQRPKIHDKEYRKVRHSTYSVYHALLYYAFRPGQAPSIVSRYWDLYVAHVADSASSKEVGLMSGVLVSLLSGTQSSLWSRSRIFSYEDTVKRDEIPIMHAIRHDEVPRLDPKWVRSNSGLIMKLIEKLWSSEAWWVAHDGHSPISDVWQAFTLSIKEAGAKEIKVSMETMNATADILGSLNRFYIQTVDSDQPNKSLRMKSLLLPLTTNLGPLVLNEKRIIKSSNGDYLASDTPSSRSSKSSGEFFSCMGFILRILTTNANVNVDREVCESLFSIVIGVVLHAGSSRGAKLQLLRELAEGLLPVQKTDIGYALWTVLAGYTNDLIASIGPTNSRDTDHHIRQEIRDATRLLENGLYLGLNKACPAWQHNLDTLVSQAKSVTSMVCCMTLVIDPLAKKLSDTLQHSKIPAHFHALTSLLNCNIWHNVGTEMGHVEDLLVCVNEILLHSFNDTSSDKPDELSGFFMSLTKFISSQPVTRCISTLQAVHPGLSQLLADPNLVLETCSESGKVLMKKAFELWKSILDTCEKILDNGSQDLSHLYTILTPGLASKHQLFANLTIDFWNQKLGSRKDISCPDNLLRVLKRLSRSTEVLLQGVSIDARRSQLAPIVYHDTLASIEELSRENETRSPFPAFMNSPALKDQRAASVDPIHSSQLTPRRPRKEPVNSTPRLRHDNSQIQFAVVNSSPSKLDTQLLTEHQLEVRERQNEEANAMFVDLRSSSRAKGKGKKLSQQRLVLPSHDMVEHSDLETISPTLPTQDNSSVLGSSPTPRQRQSTSRDTSRTRRKIDESKSEANVSPELPEIPSSPPQLPRQSQRQLTSSKTRTDKSTPVNVHIGRKPRTRSSQVEDHESDSGEQTFADAQTHLDERAGSTAVVQDVSKDQIKTLQTSIEPSDTDSMEMDQTTIYQPNSVEAQIFTDMERAASFSQDLTRSTRSTQSSQDSAASRTRSKRKALPLGSVEPGKRSRSKAEKEVVTEPELPSSVQAQEDVPDANFVSDDPLTLPVKPSRSGKRTREQEDQPASQEGRRSKRLRRTRSQSNSSANNSESSDAKLESLPMENTHTRKVTEVLPDVEEPTVVGHVEDTGNTGDALPMPQEVQDEVAIVQEETIEETRELPQRDQVVEQQPNGAEILAQAQKLLQQVKKANLGTAGDDVVATLMDIGREVIEAKRRAA